MPAPPGAPFRMDLLHNNPSHPSSGYHRYRQREAAVSSKTDNPHVIIILSWSIRQLETETLVGAAWSCKQPFVDRIPETPHSRLSSPNPSHTNQQVHKRKQHTNSVHFPHTPNGWHPLSRACHQPLEPRQRIQALFLFSRQIQRQAGHAITSLSCTRRGLHHGLPSQCRASTPKDESNRIWASRERSPEVPIRRRTQPLSRFPRASPGYPGADCERGM